MTNTPRKSIKTNYLILPSIPKIILKKESFDSESSECDIWDQPQPPVGDKNESFIINFLELFKYRHETFPNET